MFEPLIFLTISFAVLYIVGTWIVKRQQSKCPKYKYVYKPSVRTFTEEQTQPPSVYKMYSDMFYKPSVGTSKDNVGYQYNMRGGTVNPFPLGGLPTTDLGTVRESNDFLNN